MPRRRKRLTRAEILERNLDQVNDWNKTFEGLEAKAWNVESKYGRVPRELQTQLNRAEMEYCFALAIYKDNKSDPYL